MRDILLSCIAAGGSILTAYVAAVSVQTRRLVNGATTELLDRITCLEHALAVATVSPADRRNGHRD